MTRQQVSNYGLASDTARANLLANGGFEFWQRGTSFPSANGFVADRWFAGLNTGAWNVSREVSIISNASNSSCKMALSGWTAGYNYLRQQFPISEVPVRGKTISIAVDLYSNTSNVVNLRFFSNGTGSQDLRTPLNTVVNAWYRATLTITVPSDATIAYLDIEQSGNSTVYVDNAMLVVGSQAADYAPLHLADDLARCGRYYQVLGPNSGSSINISGIATAGGQTFRTTLTFIQKAVTPTITKVGTWTLGNAGGQPGIPTFDIDSLVLTVSSAAAGDTYAQNGAGCKITIESNP